MSASPSYPVDILWVKVMVLNLSILGSSMLWLSSQRSSVWLKGTDSPPNS